MELKREPVPVLELVNACLDRAQPLADRKQIRLRREPIERCYPDGRPRTDGVRRLQPADERDQVLARPRRRSTITGHHEGERFRLAVRDQGIGMDKKELQSIFQKFYRTRKAVASGEAGTGIGLSIVEQIVTHHGGRDRSGERSRRGLMLYPGVSGRGRPGR